MAESLYRFLPFFCFLNYLKAHHKRAFDTSCITSTSAHDRDIINILDTKLFYPVFHPFPLVFPYKTHSNHSFHQKRPFPFSRKGLFIDFVTISHRFTIEINRITTYDLRLIIYLHELVRYPDRHFYDE